MTATKSARGRADGEVAREFADAELFANALEYFRAGRHAEAEAAYATILAHEPGHFICLHHLGLIAHQRGDHAAAARLIEQALAIKPDYIEALSNLGAIHRALGDTEASLAATRQAIALAPEAVCERIIAQTPDSAEPYFSLGKILKELGKRGKAVETYRRALALRPDFAEVYTKLGNVLQDQEAFEAAVEAYRESLSLCPDAAETHGNMGAALENLGRLKEAIDSYRTAVKLNPNLLAIRVWLHHKRRSICDWDGIEAEENELRVLMAAAGSEPVHPFAVLGMGLSAAGQWQVSRSFAARFPAPAIEHRREDFAGARKLRIGYLSADFCRHATALLMAELFERHDKSCFEIIAYSHVPDDRGELSARLRAAFDDCVDIRAMTDAEAAGRITADRIDILVELNGYTKGARTGISALRPAPLQVSFAGFPGTMGASFIDYVIADPFVLPMDQQAFYSEKIVHLPHCYQPNSTNQPISNITPTRAGCGLPEQGFVFCSFNSSYKITPEFFGIWMRLLTAIPEAVLWLLDANDLVIDNLRGEAGTRGVDPNRLVFAPRLPSPEHLARHRLADLFLDTLPYNAHTAASDALWARLPILTCAGDTFAGRVAGSLLHAAGLPELVAGSPAAYESMALRLAREPAVLQGLRQTLLGNRLNSPLYDIARYTRHYEAALTQMWETWANGHDPAGFAISPSLPGQGVQAEARIERIATTRTSAR